MMVAPAATWEAGSVGGGTVPKRQQAVLAGRRSQAPSLVVVGAVAATLPILPLL